MRSKGAAVALAAALLAAAVAFGPACSDAFVPPYCTDIPANGCPGGDFDASTNCADPTCAAIYSHDANCRWTLVQTCAGFVPPKDAAAALEARPDSDRHDGETADGDGGCPELESPDCPLDAARGCDASCCGCQDLYVCVEGGWSTWGECGDGGALTPAMR